jgi:hypothetical protein
MGLLMTAGGAVSGVPVLTPAAALALYLTNTGLVGAQATAITDLTNSLVSANLWDKMPVIYPVAGGTAAAHKFNLKNPVDTDAGYRVTWVGTATHDANGYTGDGTTALGNTHFNFASIPSLKDNWHLSAYSRTNLASNIKEAMGIYDPNTSAGAVGINMYPRLGSGFISSNSQTASQRNIVAVASSFGFFMVNRRSSTHIRGGRLGAMSEFAGVRDIQQGHQELCMVVSVFWID